MGHAHWSLKQGRPIIEVILTLAQGGQPFGRTLLADTGAGMLGAAFEIVLDENDCVLCGGIASQKLVTLGGAYSGSFPVYSLRVQLPSLGVDQPMPVVGVPTAPAGFDGIACFPFLNRFTYGNFSDRGGFGLQP